MPSNLDPIYAGSSIVSRSFRQGGVLSSLLSASLARVVSLFHVSLVGHEHPGQRLTLEPTAIRELPAHMVGPRSVVEKRSASGCYYAAEALRLELNVTAVPVFVLSRAQDEPLLALPPVVHHETTSA